MPRDVNPKAYVKALSNSDSVAVFRDRGYGHTVDGYLTLMQPEDIVDGVLQPARSICLYMDKDALLELSDWLMRRAERQEEGSGDA